MLVAIAYSFVVTYPLIFQLGTSIYGYPGDATGTVAIYEWWSYAIRNHADIFNNTMWGAPFGAGWQAVPFSVIPVVVLAPLSAVVGGVAAYNLEILSSFPLTAWATYLVARRIRCSPPAAAFAALAFAFVPFHIEKAQGHAGQTHMELFSGTLLFLLRWRQGGSRWNLVAAGAVAGMTLWDDYYFAFINAFLVATFLVVSFTSRQDESRAEPIGRRLRRYASAAATLGVVTALFVPATVLVALRPSNGPVSGALTAQTPAFHQSLIELETYSSRPWEFFLPYHDNPLVPSGVLQFENAHLHGSNFTEQTLFLGYTVMLLAAIAVVARWPRFDIVLLLALGLVGAVVSLPPTLHLHGLDVPTPSLALYRLFPIFRVYARFGVLVIIGTALLAGIGLTWLQARLTGRRTFLLLIPFLLAAVEFNNLPPTHVTQLFPAPEEYRWLATEGPGILIEYPLDAGTLQEQEIQTRQYTLYQQAHGHPIFNGATTASYATSYYPALEPYYGPGVPDTLRSFGIRYVFVHRTDYAKDGYLLPQAVSGLTYVETLNGVDIYLVS